MTVCGLLGLRSSSRLAGVTITIVMLVQQTGSHWMVALDRVGEVILGIVVALAVSTLVFPDRARLRLRDGLAQEFLVLGAFFEASCKGFAARPRRTWRHCARTLSPALRGNNQLLEAARNEPSGGPGWREGLGMLAQFGRSIFDALVALEFAVRDSHEDALCAATGACTRPAGHRYSSGFHYLAGCIHGWRFHVPPPGLNLEEDIAQLEARMAEVRHTGFAIFAG